MRGAFVFVAEFALSVPLVGCGKTRFIHKMPWDLPYGAASKTGSGCSKRPDFSPAQPRRAKTRRSAGKAAVSEEARRTLRYVEPLSDTRTPLADFFSILLVGHYDTVPRDHT